jgi:predicted TIM-barrel fold metal-dependent hydrolase
MASVVIDIHCHGFNADDLPIRGFIHRLYLHRALLGAMLSELVDTLIQGAAPDYAADNARLDLLLGQLAFESQFELAPIAPPAIPQEQFEREVETALAELQGRNPVLVQRLGNELAAEEGQTTDAGDLEAIPDVIGNTRRAIRWVKLFGQSRLDLAAHLVRTFHDEVDLFCPMLVDLGMGLGDAPKTTMREQMELQEKISRLSMMGRLPGAGKARLHPFIGFDPRVQVKAQLVENIRTPFNLVQTAVTEYGFVGVKLYPPMGWRPIGNTESRDMTRVEAERLDEVLRAFYRWCEQEQVPVTAHCNDSNYADEAFRDYTNPDNWVRVLEEFPTLHLNLGHFGGAREREPDDGWPWRIARATGRFPHLYADVGNHRVHDRKLTNAYLGMLQRMFADPRAAGMQQRLMFGSDWYMVALHPDHDRFLTTYRQLYKDRFGTEATAGFLGDTARRFLGFNDPSNKNTRRLRARYQQYAADRMPPWLAG